MRQVVTGFQQDVAIGRDDVGIGTDGQVVDESGQPCIGSVESDVSVCRDVIGGGSIVGNGDRAVVGDHDRSGRGRVDRSVQRADSAECQQAVASNDIVDLDVSTRGAVVRGQRVDVGFQGIPTADSCPGTDFQSVGRDVVCGGIVVADGRAGIQDHLARGVGDVVQCDTVDFRDVDSARRAVDRTESGAVDVDVGRSQCRTTTDAGCRIQVDRGTGDVDRRTTLPCQVVGDGPDVVGQREVVVVGRNGHIARGGDDAQQDVFGSFQFDRAVGRGDRHTIGHGEVAVGVTGLVGARVEILAGTQRDRTGGLGGNGSRVVVEIVAGKQADVSAATGGGDVGVDGQDVGDRVSFRGQYDVTTRVVHNGAVDGQRAGGSYRDVFAVVVVGRVDDGDATDCAQGADCQAAHVVQVDVA